MLLGANGAMGRERDRVAVRRGGMQYFVDQGRRFVRT